MTRVFPEEKTVFDYYWNTEERQFLEWQTQYAAFEIDTKLQYHEIMIPNVDSARNSYVQNLLIQ